MMKDEFSINLAEENESLGFLDGLKNQQSQVTRRRK